MRFKLAFPTQRDGTVQFFGTRDRSSIIIPGQRNNLPRNGPGQPKSWKQWAGTAKIWDGTQTKRDRAEKDVLKQEKDVLKQELWSVFEIFYFILSRDIPRQRSLFRDFCFCPCPETKGHRDKKTF